MYDNGAYSLLEAKKRNRTRTCHSIGLARLLPFVFSEDEQIVDLGCGTGFYVHAMQMQGFKAVGYEYTPGINAIAHTPVTEWFDLSKPVSADIQTGQVLCLEVGEHIPEAFEKTVFNNLATVAHRKIVLSWAVPGQQGLGHVNCRPNAYVIAQLAERGWQYQEQQTRFLRDKRDEEDRSCPWFKDTIMVFDEQK